MKVKKKRTKGRTTGSDLGFDGSHMFGWPARDTPAWRKLWDRWRAGVCIGCGDKKCRCKSEH